MRPVAMAAGAMLLAAPAVAEPWGLTATPTACAALEALVVFGLVDGGIGGDTTELTSIVESGDGQRCIAWLDSYGMGDGMRLESCREAFDMLNANGLPEWESRAEPDFIRDVLAPQYEGACDDLVFDLTAGQ